MTARRPIACTLAVVTFLVLLPVVCWGLDVAVGNRVELNRKPAWARPWARWATPKATNPLGVPLHRLPRPSLAGRIADMTVGTVIGLQNDNTGSI